MGDETGQPLAAQFHATIRVQDELLDSLSQRLKEVHRMGQDINGELNTHLVRIHRILCGFALIFPHG
jgi:hypothetical protein